MSRQLTADEARELKEFAKAAFDAFDTDKSGQIETKEFEAVLRQFNDSSACKEKLADATIKQTSEVSIPANCSHSNYCDNYTDITGHSLRTTKRVCNVV